MSAASARRINRGRGHSYEVDGQPVPGVTKIIGKGFPAPALIGWAAGKTIDCALDRWNELDALLPSERRQILERARWDHLDKTAKRGKDAHALIQRLARGEEVDVPDELAGFVDAYLAFVTDWKATDVLVEASVFSLEYRYAGTPDLIAHLCDGLVWLLDFKTGAKRRVYDNFVLQLAAYRYADFYITDDGRQHEMPQIDRTGIVLLGDDSTYDLVPVNAGSDAFAVFGAAQQVFEFVTALEADSYRYIGEALPQPSPDGRTP